MLKTTNAHTYPLGGKNFVINRKSLCQAYSIRKTNLKLFHIKPTTLVSKFSWENPRWYCGPIQLSWGPLKYFMVLIDASTKWSWVCLLSTRNVAFAKFLTQRTHNSDYPIKFRRLDNVKEFTSKFFNDYFMYLRIDVEHLVSHVHTQDGLLEAFIKWMHEPW